MIILCPLVITFCFSFFYRKNVVKFLIFRKVQLPSFSCHPNRRRCHILNNVSSVPSSSKDGFNDGAMHGTVRPRRLHSGSDAVPEGEGHWRVCRRAPDDYASAQRPQLPVLCKTWVSHFYSFFNSFCVKNRLLCSSTYNILFLF